jgi:hypothetical protein
MSLTQSTWSQLSCRSTGDNGTTGVPIPRHNEPMNDAQRGGLILSFNDGQCHEGAWSLYLVLRQVGCLTVLSTMNLPFLIPM